jgi:hypothetical protein
LIVAAIISEHVINGPVEFTHGTETSSEASAAELRQCATTRRKCLRRVRRCQIWNLESPPKVPDPADERTSSKTAMVSTPAPVTRTTEATEITEEYQWHFFSVAFRVFYFAGFLR